jgi:hypothetical protein
LKLHAEKAIREALKQTASLQRFSDKPAASVSN